LCLLSFPSEVHEEKILYFLQVLAENSCAVAIIAYYGNSISSQTRLTKRWRKPKVHSIMDELETQATAAVKHGNKTNKINKHNTEN